MFFACIWTVCIPGTHGGQKKVSDPIELDLQRAAIGWVIGLEPWSPGGAASVLSG